MQNIFNFSFKIINEALKVFYSVCDYHIVSPPKVSVTNSVVLIMAIIKWLHMGGQ